MWENLKEEEKKVPSGILIKLRNSGANSFLFTVSEELSN